jgi:hypothetical protein
MLSLLNNFTEVLKNYRQDYIPNFGPITLSSLRPPIFTDFIPFKGEGFESGAGAGSDNTPPQPSFAKTFFSTLANILFIGFYLLIAGFLAMLVANDMIVMPPLLRFIAFMAALGICLTPPGMFSVFLYYIVKALYAASMNYILDPKNPDPRSYWPKIFAILPLTTTQYESGIMGALMYPFTFPKTVKAEAKLVGITHKYLETIQDSFPELDKFKVSFSNSAEIIERGLLAVANTNRRTPTDSLAEFMKLPTALPAPVTPSSPPA